MSRVQRIARWANRLAEHADRSRVLPIAVLSLLYVAVTIVFAQRKLMWNDELYTYYMARLPSMSDVWAALMSRGEQTPPFFYWTTRVSLDLFGVNNLSVRLPEILGFWVMLASLYVFVARRASSLSGVCAAAFPLVTIAYSYAFEARPYGLLLGFAAVALVSWQSVTLNRGRSIALVVWGERCSRGVHALLRSAHRIAACPRRRRAESDETSVRHGGVGGFGGLDGAACPAFTVDQSGRRVLVRVLVSAPMGEST